MRELANARGFYPVVGLAPGGGGKGFPMAAKGGSGGKGRRKGKGKGKGRGKGNGKGRSPVRPRPTAAHRDPRISGTGATPQHGPRFKRRRDGVPAAGPGVSTDEAMMVE